MTAPGETALSETAKAKLNLTLEVLGRRSDGYHELTSLVAFAVLGDEVELTPGPPLALRIEGPFAAALSGSANLVLEAAEAAKQFAPGLKLGSFKLTKRLPVAAGLGGGSADAAAALRLIARANPGALDAPRLTELAAGLGSDVTACLASRPALMTGRGERVVPIEGIPACGVVLANPRLPLAAGDVYAALGAPALASRPQPPDLPDFAGSFARLIDYARPRGNALEAPALRLAPVIGEVLGTLNAIPGARLARLSGSGPTCFALFATEEEAKEMASVLQDAHPNWWVAASRLAGAGVNLRTGGRY
jgi:4-diphosphocytidyl-2-C-methyl-D-erythritol kinase